MAPTPATLRITEGRQGKSDAPMVRSRAFQLTSKEVRASPDVVTVMFLLPSFFLYVSYDIYVPYIFLGSIHVNGIPVLVLFDSEATRSFVFLALSKRFVGAPG